MVYTWHDLFIYVALLIHICGMTHSHMWHDSLTRECMCRIFTCDMCGVCDSVLRFCVSVLSNDSFTREYICLISNALTHEGSFIYVA